MKDKAKDKKKEKKRKGKIKDNKRIVNVRILTIIEAMNFNLVLTHILLS